MTVDGLVSLARDQGFKDGVLNLWVNSVARLPFGVVQDFKRDASPADVERLVDRLIELQPNDSGALMLGYLGEPARRAIPTLRRYLWIDFCRSTEAHVGPMILGYKDALTRLSGEEVVWPAEYRTSDCDSYREKLRAERPEAFEPRSGLVNLGQTR